ncbi:MAG: dTDP-4-dehydrorhamnose reductase [Vicingaceae bacterium]
MKKILITGSNGLLGQKLVHKLKKHTNFQLIATSKGTNRIKDQSGYVYESMDIVDREEVLRVFEKHQPDVVINTAAMTNVDACEENQAKCWELNVTAVEYLIKACEKQGAHLIHLSTDFVFDGKSGPYKEVDLPNPLSYYGKSKLASEKLLQESSIKWSVVRTIIVYGIVEDMSRSNIVLWAKSALEKNEKLTIVNDQFRSPTLAEDLADGCILIAEQEKEGIFHLSGKDFMSIVELVRRVAKHYKLDDALIEEISSASLNQAAKRPPKTGFILDKAQMELGYNPHSFEEGMSILDKQLKA